MVGQIMKGFEYQVKEVCRRQAITVVFKQASDIFRFLIEPFGSSVEDEF